MDDSWEESEHVGEVVRCEFGGGVKLFACEGCKFKGCKKSQDGHD